jgi:hypothetical protein
MVAMVVTTTDRSARRSNSPHRRRDAAGPDRLTVVMLTLAGFLAVLALMAWQLGAGASVQARPVVTIRRVYETRVVETVVGGAARSSVTQSTSSSGSAGAPAPATTRSS